jgi:uncharacterized protein
MSRLPDSYPPRGVQPLDYAVGASMASFMNAVYAWMCVGLGVTAVVAWCISLNPAAMRAIFSPLTLIVLFVAEIGLVIAISRAVNQISAGAATGLFLVYSALNGLTLSAIFLVYALPTIGAAFITSAAMFGTMSLIGFVTKKDLSGLGSLLFMGLIGLIIASIVSMFWASTALMWIINYAGVVIFLGLTAYDTQMLRNLSAQTAGDPALAARLAVSGALALYLDFINLFLFMLRILGSRRN